VPKDTIPSAWKITYGDLNLKDVDFTYRLLRDTNSVNQNMNYNNIHVSRVFGTVNQFDFIGDTIYAQVNNLSAMEQCGIEIKNSTQRLE